MEIIGKIDQIIDKSEAPYKKSLVIVNVYSINGVENNSKNKQWAVEFRKNLSDLAKAFKEGDDIKTLCHSDFKKDKHANCYNNVVAEKAERI